MVRTCSIWSPGAWTPARCKLWRDLDEAGRRQLEEWIDGEGRQAVCHASQLPDFGAARVSGRELRIVGVN